MHWPWSRQPVCRICGRPMSMEWVRYSAPDGEGQWRTWVGVRRYFCPEGCNTGFYDFKKARIAGDGGQGTAPSASGLQVAAWVLAWLYTIGGLGLLYALSVYGVTLIPVPATWVRPALWLLVTAGFGAIVVLLALPPRHAPSGRAPQAAGGQPTARGASTRAGRVATATSSGLPPAGTEQPTAGAAGAGPSAATPAGRAAGPADQSGRPA